MQKYCAESVKMLDCIKHSYKKTMVDTCNRLLTQTNAKTSTRARKAADTPVATPADPILLPFLQEIIGTHV